MMKSSGSSITFHDDVDDDCEDYDWKDETDPNLRYSIKYINQNYNGNLYNEEKLVGFNTAMKDQLMSADNRSLAFTTSAYDGNDMVFPDYIRFMNQLGGSVSTYVTELKFTTKITFTAVLDDVIDIIKTITGFDNVRYEFYNSNLCNVYYTDAVTGSRTLFVRIQDSYRVVDPNADENREFTITIHGVRPLVEALYEAVHPRTLAKRLPRVTWYYGSGGRMYDKPILITEPRPCYDEFYPWIKQGIESYYEAFVTSTAPILILLGEPGTGKTSFIRNMIYQKALNTIVTYDEQLLASDGFFVNYLTNDEADLLVIEDADLLLMDRESAGNKTMSKLLNVSDGLVKIMDKKIIFTTNQTQVADIDQALLRPGRCFDSVLFRALDQTEANAAAFIGGIEAPTGKSAYTLAEIFNQELGAVHNAPKTSYGFL